MRHGCQARSFGEGIYPQQAVFETVVKDCGEVGFGGMETNWKNLERYFGQPETFAKLLADAGLSLFGAHLGGGPWDATHGVQLLEDAARTAEFVETLGGEFLVFSGTLPKERPLPDDVWQTLGAYTNQLGEVAAKSGLKALYHTHWWEPEGDGLHQLLGATDPAVVGFAFDTGHAVRAGADPVALLDAIGSRLGILHLTDWNGERRPPLGEGNADLDGIAAALDRIGFDGWIVLEEETKVGEAKDQVAAGLAVFQRLLPAGE